ncbi:WD40 repeat domain-containing protein, partial [Oceanidesulfovibrio marinus]
MWQPRFNPQDGSVVAGARQGGKWGMLKDDALIWKCTMFKCWKTAFSEEGANIWDVVCTDFGRWTEAVNGDVWGEKFQQVVGDMSVSQDGRRSSIIGKTDGQWDVSVDDTRGVGWFEMAYPAVFNPDSKQVGYAGERKGGQMTIILDGDAYHKD